MVVYCSFQISIQSIEVFSGRRDIIEIVLYAWGKYDESQSNYHCLEHHCADVAACFEILIQEPVLRSRFTLAANIDRLDSVTEARLTVIAFLHDFAKLNSGFQFKVRDQSKLPPNPPPKMGHIGVAFFCFEQIPICEAIGFPDMVDQWGIGIEALLLAALSHHGRPPVRPNLGGSGPSSIWNRFADYDPYKAAIRIGDCCRAWFPDAFLDGPQLPESPALAHLFAGTVTLADQIGSAKEYFKFHPDPNDNYINYARKQAKKIMHDRGFCRSNRPALASSLDLKSMLGFENLRPLQQTVAEAPLDCSLLILESETGSGKTEAALIRFARLWHAGLVDGLYFAVPTRASAKQLHRRIDGAIQRLFPPEPWAETVLAIPGYLISGTASGRNLPDFKVFWEDKPDEELRVARWSGESARNFLSTTSAVGTIDQALLGSLKVKWAHLRSASLSRSLLVVDEVHASDTYMTELLHTLLHDHLDLGGHGMLMSATLGSSARIKLSNRNPTSEIPTASKAELDPYPILTQINNGKSKICEILETGISKDVEMRLEPWLASPDFVAERALVEARKGGKVLVIRNTVATAQAVFSEILARQGEELVFTVNEIPTLHHSRFAVEDRILMDDAIENTLGKDRGVGGTIVVGTQTLEQSLDIDADFLISDLCPVDVLLQRIGRLHRHTQHHRSVSFTQPRCVVLDSDSGLDLGLDGNLLKYGLGVSESGGIYRNLLSIEQTRNLIIQFPVWTIPKMNRMLVERATHPEHLQNLAENLKGPWLVHEQKTFGLDAAEMQRAKNHALSRREPFKDLIFPDLDEVVRTRLGEDGPRIKLDEPVSGPFGNPIQTINLPAHMFRKEELISANKDKLKTLTEVSDGCIIFHIGDHKFRYDQMGIRKIER